MRQMLGGDMDAPTRSSSDKRIPLLGYRRSMTMIALFCAVPISLLATARLVTIFDLHLLWALPLYSLIGTICTMGLILAQYVARID